MSAPPVTVADLRELARRRLPRMVFDLVDGGAEDEVTLRANREAFAALALRPRVLVDVAERSQAVTVLGRELALPVVLGPTGLMRMVAHEGERAAAVAADRGRGRLRPHRRVGDPSRRDRPHARADRQAGVAGVDASAVCTRPMAGWTPSAAPSLAQLA